VYALCCPMARNSGDIVLSAIGLRPRIALAKEAGLTVNRGIVVDKTLATSQPIFMLWVIVPKSKA
jgi:NAD(P)H-nitrite reductase large subunit